MTGELKFDEKETLTPERFIAFATQELGRDLTNVELEGVSRLVEERGLAEVYGGFLSVVADWQECECDTGLTFQEYLDEIAQKSVPGAIELQLWVEENILRSEDEIDY